MAKRDYKAEYARRIASGLARGLSRSQARGHAAEQGQPAITELKETGHLPSRQPLLDRFYGVTKRLARGESMTKAARAEGIASKTIKQLNQERDIYQPIPRYNKAGKPRGIRGYQVAAHARMPILTTSGQLHEGVPWDTKNASLVGIYWNAVIAALRGKTKALQAFNRIVVYDLFGNQYEPLTDINALYRFFESMTDDAHADFDRTFYTGREVLYAPTV